VGVGAWRLHAALRAAELIQAQGAGACALSPNPSPSPICAWLSGWRLTWRCARPASGASPRAPCWLQRPPRACGRPPSGARALLMPSCWCARHPPRHLAPRPTCSPHARGPPWCRTGAAARARPARGVGVTRVACEMRFTADVYGTGRGPMKQPSSPHPPCLWPLLLPLSGFNARCAHVEPPCVPGKR
jgi:hypothetical protein